MNFKLQGVLLTFFLIACYGVKLQEQQDAATAAALIPIDIQPLPISPRIPCCQKTQLFQDIRNELQDALDLMDNKYCPCIDGTIKLLNVRLAYTWVAR